MGSGPAPTDTMRSGAANPFGLRAYPLDRAVGRPRRDGSPSTRPGSEDGPGRGGRGPGNGIRGRGGPLSVGVGSNRSGPPMKGRYRQNKELGESLRARFTRFVPFRVKPLTWEEVV